MACVGLRPNVQTVDDYVTDAERAVLAEVVPRAERRCPYLGQTGEHVLFCSRLIPPETQLAFPFVADPSPNPQLASRQESSELQFYCIDRYEACMHYPHQ